MTYKTRKGPENGSTQKLSEREVKRALEELIRGLGHDPNLIPVEELQRVADRLSQVAGKDPAWGWRYLRNVLNEKIEASGKLVQAIFALGAMIDGVPVELATGQRVTVVAVGKVKPGAVVLGSSRPCGNPACGIEFVPSVPWQKYHSPDCRKGSPQRHEEGSNRKDTEARR